MSLQYNLLGNSGTKFLTVVLDGNLLSATSDHPNWDRILELVMAEKTDGLAELFEPAKKISENFKRVSDRVSLSGGRVLFDGDEVDNSLTKAILRLVEEDTDDYLPFVKFMEKVETNPQEHSREQLYSWLAKNQFTIDEDGDIIGYKSVRKVDDPTQDDGLFQSINSGTAWVNGVKHEGQIPQRVGDVVTMPRSKVAWSPSNGCAAGLHVANWYYANTWTSHDAVLLVKVNPRDVVSVPTDSNFSKVRVCRYEVYGLADGSPVDQFILAKP